MNRSRRIKCDEQKPRCYECQIYDFKCVGLFYQGLTTATETPIRSCVTDNISPRVGATSDVRDVLYLAPSLGRNNNGSEAIIGKLPLYMGSMAKLRNSYMAFLPAMAGYEIALDKAVQCVAAALREIYCKREYPSSSLQARWQSVNLYIEALKHLQVAINDRRRSVSSEILCATLLLCFYEVSNLIRGTKRTNVLYMLISIIQRVFVQQERHKRDLFNMLRERQN